MLLDKDQIPNLVETFNNLMNINLNKNKNKSTAINYIFLFLWYTFMKHHPGHEVNWMSNSRT